MQIKKGPRRRAAATRGLHDGPCLVVDLDVVRENYEAFAKALPGSRVFYAVKANPALELLTLLVSLGSCFDAASNAISPASIGSRADHCRDWIQSMACATAGHVPGAFRRGKKLLGFFVPSEKATQVFALLA